jgi:hypothetical protein
VHFEASGKAKQWGQGLTSNWQREHAVGIHVLQSVHFAGWRGRPPTLCHRAEVVMSGDSRLTRHNAMQAAYVRFVPRERESSTIRFTDWRLSTGFVPIRER